MAWRACWTICNSHLWTNERVSQKRNTKYRFESVSFSRHAPISLPSMCGSVSLHSKKEEEERKPEQIQYLFNRLESSSGSPASSKDSTALRRRFTLEKSRSAERQVVPTGTRWSSGSILVCLVIPQQPSRVLPSRTKTRFPARSRSRKEKKRRNVRGASVGRAA